MSLYPKNYSNIDFLNDCNHILRKHSDESNQLFSVLSCNSSNCLLFSRNCRNREQTDSNKALLLQTYFTHDQKTRIALQFLDRAHSFYFHRNQFRFQMMNNDQRQHAFITTHNEYQCGFRYFYWKYYEHQNTPYDDAHWASGLRKCISVPVANASYNVSDFYIEHKYSSFKQEMTCNDIKTVSNFVWNDLVGKAHDHIRTQYFRSIYCPRGSYQSARCYDMKYKQSISYQHILSLLIYCGFDNLQREFSKTYRKKNKNESIDAMKERHSNFYFLGKYLRECVECFGMEWNKTTGESLRLYHGLTGQLSFHSIFSCIKGPLSATMDHQVAQNFGMQGIVMTLDIFADEFRFKFDEYFDTKQRITCFPAYMVSNFQNEQEILLLGGLNHFYIVGITDFYGNCYDIYISALSQATFNCVMKNSWGNSTNMPSSGRDESILIMTFKILQHQLYKAYVDEDKKKMFAHIKNCPSYIDDLMDRHFQSVASINLSSKPDPVQRQLMFDSNGLIQIERIVKLFPNIEEISFDGRHVDLECLMNPVIYNSVLSIFQNHKLTIRIQIYLFDNFDYPISCSGSGWKINTHIMRFQDKFAACSSMIGLQKTANYKTGINAHIASSEDKYEIVMAPEGSFIPLIFNTKVDYIKFYLPFIFDPVFAIICLWEVVKVGKRFDLLAGVVIVFIVFHVFQWKYDEHVLLKKYVSAKSGDFGIKRYFIYKYLLFHTILIIVLNHCNRYAHILFWFSIIEICQAVFIHERIVSDYDSTLNIGGSESIASKQTRNYLSSPIFRICSCLCGSYMITELFARVFYFKQYYFPWRTLIIMGLVLLCITDDTIFLQLIFGVTNPPNNVITVIHKACGYFGIFCAIGLDSCLFYLDLYLEHGIWKTVFSNFCDWDPFQTASSRASFTNLIIIYSGMCWKLCCWMRLYCKLFKYYR
eukprot:1667_1